MKFLQPFPLLWLMLALTLFCGPGVVLASTAASSMERVYFGTYTQGRSKGIYMAEFDPVTGKLSTPELAIETKSPSFLAVHPTHRVLYAVGEMSNFGGKKTGAVSAFLIEPKTGKLTLMNEQSSGGGGPCHLALDHTGKCLLVANYGSGSIAALPLAADGKLGEPVTVIQHEGSSVDADRQTGPHAHFITSDSANRFALACDLGLDKVLVYRLAASKATLAPNDPPTVDIKPGSGPRHLVFHPKGKTAYLLNEMSSTLTVLSYDPKAGALKVMQTISTLPDNFAGKSSGAEVQIHPSGKFVYASNRGHDSIAVFSVDAKTGRLAVVEHQPTQGKTPRHFALDPSGKWLLAENQDSHSVVMFSVDARTGQLTPTGQTVTVGSPVCALFVARE